jgi:hypothetical protein
MNETAVGNASWWRFNRYEIRNSWIQPAPGARLQSYDPWSNRDEGSAPGQKNPSAYRELLGLLSTLQRDPGFATVIQAINVGLPLQFWRRRPVTLKASSEAKIIAWCETYGLLGILPHQALQITLPARSVELSKRERDEMVALGAEPDLVPTTIPRRTQYTRTAGGWRQSEGLPVDSSLGSVLVLGWNGATLTRSTLRDIAGFFPEISAPEQSNAWETYHYPLPLSRRFWELYSEPISAFALCALLLSDAVDAMGIRKTPRTKKEKDRFSRLGTLDGLLAPIGMTYEFKKNIGVRPRAIAPSLLSMLTLMALQDLPKGRVRQCEVCSAPFISGAHPWTRYCSKRCRSTAQQRAYRERLRNGGDV